MIVADPELVGALEEHADVALIAQRAEAAARGASAHRPSSRTSLPTTPIFAPRVPRLCTAEEQRETLAISGAKRGRRRP